MRVQRERDKFLRALPDGCVPVELIPQGKKPPVTFDDALIAESMAAKIVRK